jgi:hypothetical protein
LNQSYSAQKSFYIFLPVWSTKAIINTLAALILKEEYPSVHGMAGWLETRTVFQVAGRGGTALNGNRLPLFWSVATHLLREFQVKLH